MKSSLQQFMRVGMKVVGLHSFATSNTLSLPSISQKYNAEKKMEGNVFLLKFQAQANYNHVKQIEFITETKLMQA